MKIKTTLNNREKTRKTRNRKKYPNNWWWWRIFALNLCRIIIMRRKLQKTKKYKQKTVFFNFRFPFFILSFSLFCYFISHFLFLKLSHFIWFGRSFSVSFHYVFSFSFLLLILINLLFDSFFFFYIICHFHLVFVFYFSFPRFFFKHSQFVRFLVCFYFPVFSVEFSSSLPLAQYFTLFSGFSSSNFLQFVKKIETSPLATQAIESSLLFVHNKIGYKLLNINKL